MFFLFFDEIPRRLFGGGAYLIFCPKCCGYSRAPLIRINTVSPGQLHATPKEKKPLHLIHRQVSMVHLFKSVFSDIVFHLIFSAILKSGLCTVWTLVISLARRFRNTRKKAEYPRQFNTT